MRILLMPNFTKPRTWEVLRELCGRMEAMGLTAAAVEKDYRPIAAAGIGPVENAGEDAIRAAESCDLLLSIGGDGTMIHSARHAAQSRRPVVGVNLGRLGFLAQIEPEGLEHYLLCLKEGRYQREGRYAIGVSRRDTGEELLPFAINDIVLTKDPGQNLADFEIFCNGKLIDHYYADGVIFSTPTGSTAYALSAGGPVLDPALKAIVMVPICPHSISIRPIVFHGEKTISIRSQGALQAIADGADKAFLPPGQAVTVGRSKLEPEFISFGENEFFEILTAKIKQRG